MTHSQELRDLAGETHDSDTDAGSSLRPPLLDLLRPISVHANELIDDFTASETAPCCGLMAHGPATPVSKLKGEHHTVASGAAHAPTSSHYDGITSVILFVKYRGMFGH